MANHMCPLMNCHDSEDVEKRIVASDVINIVFLKCL